jgi:hypothetical protein
MGPELHIDGVLRRKGEMLFRRLRVDQFDHSG